MIFLCILIQTSLKFVCEGQIDNKWALVQVMAWVQNRQQAIIWTNVGPVNQRIYAALWEDELNGCNGEELLNGL